MSLLKDLFFKPKSEQELDAQIVEMRSLLALPEFNSLAKLVIDRVRAIDNVIINNLDKDDNRDFMNKLRGKREAYIELITTTEQMAARETNAEVELSNIPVNEHKLEENRRDL